MRNVLVVVCMFAIVFLAVGCSHENVAGPVSSENVNLSPQNANPAVVPPNARPGGQSYGEWAADWFQWLALILPNENPGLDPDGSFIPLHQSGHVWFLAPNYGNGAVDVRYATIPPGKMLFLDVAALVASPGLGLPSDPEELAALLKATVDQFVEVSLEIDGRPLSNVSDYRVVSPFFELTLPPGNVWGAPPGTFPALTEGYYVMLEPLAAGEHTIHLFADMGPLFGTSEVTFHLTVAN